MARARLRPPPRGVPGAAFGALLGALLVTGSVAGQQLRPGDVSAGVQFQGYDFDDGLGVEAANLFVLPIAYDQDVGDRLAFDLYGAYARGAALIGGTEFTLSGPVDTRVRANYAVAPWALLTFGLNLPTGQAQHTEDEARVAAALATDLLGFREANFGLGLAVTTGIATAHQLGETGVGLGVSYRYASGYEPRADTALRYTPGNELRVRVGLDRNVAGNRLTGGVTYQNFSHDRMDGRDLFQPGGRWRGDVSYSFRTGASAAWTAYVTDVWRDHGDVRLDVLAPGSGTDTASTLRTGTQNLFVAGVAGSWRVAPGWTLLPTADMRRLSRQDPGGDGWLVGAGTAVPLGVRALLVTPAVRLSYGRLEGEDAAARSVRGAEVEVTIGWSGR